MLRLFAVLLLFLLIGFMLVYSNPHQVLPYAPPTRAPTVTLERFYEGKP